MSEWRPTEEYRRIADANRRYYAAYASQYDATECCVSDARLQKGLENDLDEALALIGKHPSAIQALDACGGSGNVSLKLLRRGVDVTLVDVSADLQEIFRRKCETSGFRPRIVLAEVGAFLAETNQTFDLIVFSSALHHLESIEPVLREALHRLKPSGVLLTTFDPTLQERLRLRTRVLQRAEYLAFKLFCQTRDLPRAMLRRMRRVVSGASPRNKSDAALDDSTAGMLAEYHIERGIDDLALVKRLESAGYQIASHRRYVETRFRLTQRFIEQTGDVTHFKLLLLRPAS
jgi:ubiquinone/menaquinone biosynthesis C-methylase UbiE